MKRQLGTESRSCLEGREGTGVIARKVGGGWGKREEDDTVMLGRYYGGPYQPVYGVLRIPHGGK